MVLKKRYRFGGGSEVAEEANGSVVRKTATEEDGKMLIRAERFAFQ